MSVPEGIYCSFVVKLWIEESDSGADHGVWRGHITHAASGDRHYVKDLAGITKFIAPYIEEMGVQPSSESAFGRWLRFLNRASDPR